MVNHHLGNMFDFFQPQANLRFGVFFLLQKCEVTTSGCRNHEAENMSKIAANRKR